MSNSFISTIIDTLKSLLTSRGTQLFVRIITYTAGAVGGAELASENSVNAMAAGGVALVGFVLDIISHRTQKSSSTEQTK